MIKQQDSKGLQGVNKSAEEVNGKTLFVLATTCPPKFYLHLTKQPINLNTVPNRLKKQSHIDWKFIRTLYVNSWKKIELPFPLKVSYIQQQKQKNLGVCFAIHSVYLLKLNIKKSRHFKEVLFCQCPKLRNNTEATESPTLLHHRTHTSLTHWKGYFPTVHPNSRAENCK